MRSREFMAPARATMTTTASAAFKSIIIWRYVWYAIAALAVMVGAIIAGNLWFLNFIHVSVSLLWTGIDLFMGFLLGPILRRVDIPVRREIVRRLTPKTLFLMPDRKSTRLNSSHGYISYA